MFRKIALGLACVLATTSTTVRAAPAPSPEAFKQCVLDHTSPADRQELVLWLFTVVSRHPALSQISAVTPKQADDAARGMGSLIDRLLTRDCREEAVANMNNMSGAFGALGEQAMRDMMSDPNVRSGLVNYMKYVDTTKIAEMAIESESKKPTK